MPAGRPPKPTALKVLSGTARADRMTPAEMAPAGLSALPLPPPELGDVARAEWQTTTATLYGLRMLHAVDLPLLVAYCRAVESMVEADAKISKQGKVLKAKNGRGATYYVKNPWLGIYAEALATVLKLAGQFGFTPSARTRISSGQAPALADPADDILN